MNDLKIDWKQERPKSINEIDFWQSIHLTRIDNWPKAANSLIEAISGTHCNGGIQLHKYKLSANKDFEWFAARNRLEEINFIENIIRHKILQDYRDDLQISEAKPKIKYFKNWTDIYDLPGEFARIMGLGGAYKKIDQQVAWDIATRFVKEEFQNRFEEVIKFDFAVDTAKWFHDIAWDYSIMLFDKRNYEITLIDITDTD